MKTKKYNAVVHIRSYKEVNAVHDTAVKVFTSMSANADVFPNPNPTLPELETESNTLNSLISDALTGNYQKTQARNDQSLKVLNMLHAEASYVSLLANNDRNMILLSGFESSSDPSPHAIPDRVIINKITDGATNHSAKIMIAPIGDTAMFTVQIYKATDPQKTFTTILQTSNSKNLILENLEKGVEIFLRISARNARGESQWSETASFLPR